MSKQKFMLQHMTWKEVDEAFKKDPVILIPLGSMEVHGPQSIVGDYIAAEEAAKTIAQKSGSYTMPVIPFGHSEYFRGFPGTISFSPETFTAVITDVFQNLMEHGIRKIVVVNGHAGNVPMLEMFGRKLRREKKLLFARFDIWQVLTSEMKKEFYGDRAPEIMGHGGEPVTSVMHYLRPDEMRPDLVGPKDRIQEWRGIKMNHFNRTTIAGQEVTFYWDFEDLTPQGTLGDPLFGNAQLGEKIFNRMVEVGCAVVDVMKKTSMEL